MSDDQYQVWEEDVEVLAQIGQALFVQPLVVSVRLQRSLAEKARDAWLRDEEGAETPPHETPEQRSVRHHAGALGLIGRSVEEGGSEVGDEVIVEIDAWQIGNALDAADASGLLRDLWPPGRQ